MLGREPKITDFGLAKQLGDLAEGTYTGFETRTGAILGTPAYLAPEIAGGHPEAANPVVDVYSLGAILYECLTGRPPFQATSLLETLERVRTQDPVPPRRLQPDVPRDLETITLKCLQKDPAKRYTSAADLATDLGRFLAGEPIVAQPVGLLERTIKWARRRPAVALLVAVSTAAVLALWVLGVVAVWQGQKATAAQRARERAQVDALLFADPHEVPTILKEMANFQEDVLPRLRQVWEEPNTPQNKLRRMRAALALLPVDPDEVRDELLEWLLAAEDSAEVLLVRRALEPHAADLREQLWQRADSAKTPEDHFRALVALARFDPTDRRWLSSGKVATQSLLSANPLHLRDWVEAMEPVKDVLLEPLGQAFRDRQRPDRGLVAANLLARYIDDRPGVLNELVIDADASQYRRLRPLLDRHRDDGVRRMVEEIEAQPDWWKDRPLDPTWKDPTAPLREEVQRAGGLFADRFAMCQELPLDRLMAVTEGLRDCGYRPVTVRPWATHVAVVWTRDGSDWRLESGLTAEELKARDVHWQKAGLIPADVAAYPGEGDRYSCVWRRGVVGEKSALYVGVTNEQHLSQQEQLRSTGHDPARVQVCLSRGVVRYAGVWVQTASRPPGYRLPWGEPEPAYAGKVLEADQLLLDVSVGTADLPSLANWLEERLKNAIAATRANPQHLGAAYDLAETLFLIGRSDEALKALDAVLAKVQHAPAIRYRVLLHARAGRATQAKDDLIAFVKAGATRVQVLATAALVRLELGEGDLALTELNRAVEAAPTDASLLYTAAQAHAQAARLEQVRQVAWAVSRIASPQCWGGLAAPPNANAASNHTRQALALLERALTAGHRDFAGLRTDTELVPLHGLAGWAELLARHGMNRHYASVWITDHSREATGLHGLAPDEHLKRCRELIEQGWRPVALSLTAVAGERTPVAASVWHRPTLPVAEQERLARRKATAAIALLQLGHDQPTWPLFRHSPDPTVRSYLVQRCRTLGVHPRLLMARLEVEPDRSARRALILALGEYSEVELPAEMRQPLLTKLLSMYRDDTDAGTHGAIDWVLRHGPQREQLEPIDRELARLPLPSMQGENQRRWYVNGQGQTFTLVRGPVEVRLGSRNTDADAQSNERPGRRRVSRDFAIASKPVTVEQWQRFLKERPDLLAHRQTQYSPEATGPINSVTWYEAAQYCNWLSEKEGIAKDQWVYPDNISNGMKLFPDYLRRTGYRLPTEAEWEYAARAEASTVRHFGGSVELLPRYAVFLDNSDNHMWPVGQKRPNDLGLFDMHGNVWTWCQDRYLYHPRTGTDAVGEDAEDVEVVSDTVPRVLRGAAFVHSAKDVRAAFRIGYAPTARFFSFGLRPARTWPRDSFPKGTGGGRE